MTRIMITATPATRGIENQKRFSKVSRDRSRLLTRQSLFQDWESISPRRESMRRSASLFKASASLLRASTFLFESLCCRSNWSWRWARRAISGCQLSCWVMSIPPERAGVWVF